jgi:CRP-like cAMP-binding protein
MPKNSPTRSPKTLSTDSSNDGRDGGEVGNQILLNLPRRESNQLSPALEFVRLKLHEVLHEAGEPIRSVYFLNHGLGSVLTTQPHGKTVEVGLIGNEGFVGVPVIFGFKSSGLRVVVQGEGTAYRADVDSLLRILPRCPVLEKHLQRFSLILGMQSTQLAACNRLHDVPERLARWLLMSQDRIGGHLLPLTQEFLSQMLGTRRASVTVAAGTLQKAGMIQYSRGSVTILDRPKLEAAACACYGLVERQKMKWQEEAS